jgi:hypothetical protein
MKKFKILFSALSGISLLIASYQFIEGEYKFGLLSILYAMIFLIVAIHFKRRISNEKK